MKNIYKTEKGIISHEDISSDLNYNIYQLFNPKFDIVNIKKHKNIITFDIKRLNNSLKNLCYIKKENFIAEYRILENNKKWYSYTSFIDNKASSYIIEYLNIK